MYRDHHKIKGRRSKRHGVTLVESAIVLPVLFWMIFAMLDLGIATLRYNTLAHASQRIAREVVRHGSESPVAVGAWGPATYEGSANDGTPIVASVDDLLPTMSPSDVLVRVEWLDNDNSPRDRVHVELNYVHQPLIAGLSPWGELELRAASTMRIIN
jgi:hypothetical protein